MDAITDVAESICGENSKVCPLHKLFFTKECALNRTVVVVHSSIDVALKSLLLDVDLNPYTSSTEF